jgi:hypothetical protein
LLPSPRRGRPPGKLGSGSTNRPLWESGFAIIVLDSATCLDPIEWFISGHPEICNDAIGCGLHQFGGGEVADPVAGLDRGHTQGDQGVALPVPAGPDQTQVLVGCDSFEAGQVVEGRAGIEAATSDGVLSSLG